MSIFCNLQNKVIMKCITLTAVLQYTELLHCDFDLNICGIPDRNETYHMKWLKQFLGTFQIAFQL